MIAGAIDQGHDLPGKLSVRDGCEDPFTVRQTTEECDWKAETVILKLSL
jgi:hypothetical protein